MRYRLKAAVPFLNLVPGDEFVFRKQGYTHNYNLDDWIGLPSKIVEDNPVYFASVEEPPKLIDDFMEHLKAFAFLSAKLIKEYSKVKNDRATARPATRTRKRRNPVVD